MRTGMYIAETNRNRVVRVDAGGMIFVVVGTGTQGFGGDGGTVIGSAVVNGGSATVALTSLGLGTHLLEARYDTLLQHAAAVSLTVNQPSLRRFP